MSTSSEPPVAVICVPSGEVLRAVRKLMPDHEFEALREEATTYFTTDVAGASGDWRLALAVTGLGNSDASQRTERAIATFKPQAVVAVGSAVGLKEVAVGDVIAAHRVYGYESAAVHSDELRSQPRDYRASADFRNLIETADIDPKVLRRLRLDTDQTPPRIYFKPLGSGEKEIQDPQTAFEGFIGLHYADTVALDTGSLGVVEAADGRKGVSAMAIRGVTRTQGTEALDVAAGVAAIRNAAAVALEVLSLFEFERPRSAKTPAPGAAAGTTIINHNYNVEGPAGAVGQYATSYVGAMGEKAQGTVAPASAAEAPQHARSDEDRPYNGPRHVFRLPIPDAECTVRFDERFRTTTDTVWGLNRTLEAAVIADRSDVDLESELQRCEDEHLATALKRLGIPRRLWFKVDSGEFGSTWGPGLWEERIRTRVAESGTEVVPAFVLRLPEPLGSRVEYSDRFDHLRRLANDGKAPVVVQVVDPALAGAMEKARDVLGALQGPGRPEIEELVVRGWWSRAAATARSDRSIEDALSDLAHAMDGTPGESALSKEKSILDLLQHYRMTDFDGWLAFLVGEGVRSFDGESKAIARAVVQIAAQTDDEMTELLRALPDRILSDHGLLLAVTRDLLGTVVLGLVRLGRLERHSDLLELAGEPVVNEIVQAYNRNRQDWRDGESLYDFGGATSARIAWRTGLATERLLGARRFLHPLDWVGLHHVSLSEPTVSILADLDEPLRDLIGFVNERTIVDSVRSGHHDELRECAHPTLPLSDNPKGR